MRAIVADDHPLFREAASARLSRSLPGIVIEEASDFATLLKIGAAAPRDVTLVLLDLNMPGMADGAGIRRVVETYPNAAVVLMSGLATPAEIKAAVRSGVRGFLPKTMAPDLFGSALALIANGGTYLPTDVLQPGATDNRPAGLAPSVGQLTPREQQVLVRLASGAPNKEIGRDLGLSEITVKLHVRQILKKIGARNRSEAVAIAIRSGMF